MYRTLSLSFAVLLPLCTGAVACNNPPGGLGFGRPAFTQPTPPPLVPVAITQVYAPITVGTANTGYVQLENQSGGPIDFNQTSLSLVSRDGAMDIGHATVAGGDANQVWGAGNRRAITLLTALQVHASAGELAVFNGGSIAGYAAWGGDPNAKTDFRTEAVFAGAPMAFASPALPFPGPNGQAINLDSNVNAVCVNPNAAATPGAAATCDAVTGPGVTGLQITRVAWPDLDPNGGYIEVRNNAQPARPVDLYGIQVCTSSCTPLAYSSADPNHWAGLLAAPSAVAAGSIDPARAVIYTGLSAANANGLLTSDVVQAAPAGEAYLLRPAANPNAPNANDILAYTRWGNPNLSNTIANLAIQNGVWGSTNNNPNSVIPATVDGESILNRLDGTFEPSATAAQTAPDLTTWDSCSLPQNPAPAPSFTIQEIANTTPPRLHIQGTSSVTHLSLLLGNQNFALNSNAANPNSLWVELQPGTAPCTALQHVCLHNTSLAAQEATLVTDVNNPNTVVFHVQWGTPTTSINGNTAVQNHLWPMDTCRAPGPPTNRSAVLAPSTPTGTLGEGAGDYLIAYPTLP